MASLSGCCLVHNPFKAGFQLRVVHLSLGVASSPGGRDSGGAVGQKLCREFIQNFGLRLFSPQESQLPPAGGGFSHDRQMEDERTEDRKRENSLLCISVCVLEREDTWTLINTLV